MKRSWVIAASTAAAVFFFLAAVGSGQDQEKKENKAAKDISDREFFMKASADGLAEVNLGRLAAQRATMDETRKYGQRMVEDHSRANEELLMLANKKQIPVARQMGEKHQQLMGELAKLQGAEFDRTYMDHMVKDHEKAVELFSAKAEKAEDDDVKAFAEKTLPTLKEHLKGAKELAGKFKENKENKENKDE